MADPIIDNAIRAQAVFSGPSGLPQDQYVNSFAFIRGAGHATASFGDGAAMVSERLREFYGESVAAGAALTTLRDFVHIDVINRPLTIRCYDLGQTPPREPLTFEHDLSGGYPAAEALPQEVAVCASFYGDRNIPRQRGRIYFGPLNVQALTGTASARPNPALLSTLRDACVRLAAEGVGDSHDWCVLSPTSGLVHPVTAGWVDNEFDTQRRRGLEASSRLEWPTT